MKASLEKLREELQNNNTLEVIRLCGSVRPQKVVDVISDWEPEEIHQLLVLQPAYIRTEIFSNLPEDLQLNVVSRMKRDQLAALITDMASDDRVDLLQNLSEEVRENLLPAIAQAEREDIRQLSSYAEGTAGAAMTSEYVALEPVVTAANAIAILRKEAPDKETIYDVYVVNEQRQLVGVTSLKDIILAQPSTTIKEIMNTDVVSVHANEDQEKAARTLQNYDLLTLPVVDDRQVLLGVITHDDALDILVQEQTEDIEKIMAIGGLHEVGIYMRQSPWQHFLNRIGWLVGLAVLGMVSGFVVQNFEHVLMQVTLLAAFMPMLADTGGNAGSQSATLVIRGLALGEIKIGDFLRVISKELQVALLMGVFLSMLVFLRVLFFTGSASLPPGVTTFKVGIAVAMALGIQVVSSTLIGACLPLVVHRFGKDPAVIASPAITTFVDITGLLIYFSIARFLLEI